MLRYITIVHIIIAFYKTTSLSSPFFSRFVLKLQHTFMFSVFQSVYVCISVLMTSHHSSLGDTCSIVHGKLFEVQLQVKNYHTRAEIKLHVD